MKPAIAGAPALRGCTGYSLPLHLPAPDFHNDSTCRGHHIAASVLPRKPSSCGWGMKPTFLADIPLLSSQPLSGSLAQGSQAPGSPLCQTWMPSLQCEGRPVFT